MGRPERLTQTESHSRGRQRLWSSPVDGRAKRHKNFDSTCLPSGMSAFLTDAPFQEITHTRQPTFISVADVDVCSPRRIVVLEHGHGRENFETSPAKVTAAETCYEVFMAKDIFGERFQDGEYELLGRQRAIPEPSQTLIHIHPVKRPASFRNVNPYRSNLIAEVRRILVGNVPGQTYLPLA